MQKDSSPGDKTHVSNVEQKAALTKATVHEVIRNPFWYKAKHFENLFW